LFQSKEVRGAQYSLFLFCGRRGGGREGGRDRCESGVKAGRPWERRVVLIPVEGGEGGAILAVLILCSREGGREGGIVKMCLSRAKRQEKQAQTSE